MTLPAVRGHGRPARPSAAASGACAGAYGGLPSLRGPPQVGDPPAQAAGRADDRGGEEERVDDVELHEDRVDDRHAAAEHELGPRLGRRRARVGDHVVREQHERHAGHDAERGVELDAPEPVPDEGLDEERAHPADDQRHPAGEHRVDHGARGQDDNGDEEPEVAAGPLGEHVGRRDADPATRTRSSVMAMPKLDGFMKWRIRPAMGACRKCFWLTAITTPNRTGQNWLLA